MPDWRRFAAMFETVDRKWTLREWWGIGLGLHRAVSRWELALQLLGLVLAGIAIYGSVRNMTSDSPVLSSWILFALGASAGIGIGLQVKYSRERAKRKRERASRKRH
jgi:hypothetical protein